MIGLMTLLASAALLLPPPVPAHIGSVTGCSAWSSTVGCEGFWWYANGGPAVYDAGTGQVVPGYVYVDDTTPCGPGEPYPMNTITAPNGSAACEQNWVAYYRPQATVLWAASTGAHFRQSNATLLEWYPCYGRPLRVPLGYGGYILQRYFNCQGIGLQYARFPRLWRSAERGRGLKVMAWY